MIKANSLDKGLIIELLTKSFEENQSVNYIILQDDKRLTRIHALMDYSFEMCYRFGEIWLSDDKQACALILYPNQKVTTAQSILLGIRLIYQAIGVRGFGKTMKREALVKQKQDNERMVYLWFIGVNPTHQHSGIGSILLQEVLEEAKKKSLPVYLETSTQSNLPWYERFNFRIYNKLELGYTLYFLRCQSDKPKY